jgi:hypothetical protein
MIRPPRTSLFFANQIYSARNHGAFCGMTADDVINRCSVTLVCFAATAICDLLSTRAPWKYYQAQS